MRYWMLAVVLIAILLCLAVIVYAGTDRFGIPIAPPAPTSTTEVQSGTHEVENNTLNNLQLQDASIPCHSVFSGDLVPPAPDGTVWGLAWNWLSSDRELLLSAECDTDVTIVTVGNGNETGDATNNFRGLTFVYHQGYWNDDAGGGWQPYSLSCSGNDTTKVVGQWCKGSATASIPSSTKRFVGYVCIWTGSSWQCGCTDTSCTQSYWQLQRVENEATPSGNQTFQWPVDNPHIGQQYACFNCINNGRYRTGIDMSSDSYTTNLYDTPIKVVKYGIIEGIFRTSDSSTTWCDGTTDNFISISTNNHGLGNSIILKHDIEENTVYTLYGHLDCINREIVEKFIRIGGATPDVAVSNILGKMGNSAYETRKCDPGMDCSPSRADTQPGFPPHLHFEIKAWGVLGNLSDHSGPYYGYTPDVPNWYGYLNPNPFLDYTLNTLAPTAIRITTDNQPVRTGPDPDLYKLILTTVSNNQRFVTFSEHNGWYQIYLPSNDGPATGWTQGTVDLNANRVVVNDPDPVMRVSGVNVRNEPSVSSTQLTKVWNNQEFVTTDSPANGEGCDSQWYKIYLDEDIDSSQGWICSEYLEIQ